MTLILNTNWHLIPDHRVALESALWQRLSAIKVELDWMDWFSLATHNSGLPASEKVNISLPKRTCQHVSTRLDSYPHYTQLWLQNNFLLRVSHALFTISSGKFGQLHYKKYTKYHFEC